MRWMRGAVLAGMLGPLASGAAAETLRAVGSLPAGHSSTQAMERAAGELREKTFERLTLEVEAAPALDPGEVVQTVQNGEAALGWTDLEALAPLVPAYGAMSLPFLFDDRSALFELLAVDDGLGLLLDDELKQHGLTAIGFMDGGERRLASTAGAIGSMDDLVDRRILVGGGERRLAAMAATGMAPVAAGGDVSDTELREARLQDLPGGSTPLGTLTVTDAPQAVDVIVVLANRARLSELPLDLNEQLVEATRSAVTWQRGFMAEADAQAARDLEKQGVSFAPLPPDVRAAAKQRVKDMVATGALPDDPLIEAVLANVD